MFYTHIVPTCTIVAYFITQMMFAFAYTPYVYGQEDGGLTQTSQNKTKQNKYISDLVGSTLRQSKEKLLKEIQQHEDSQQNTDDSFSPSGGVTAPDTQMPSVSQKQNDVTNRPIIITPSPTKWGIEAIEVANKGTYINLIINALPAEHFNKNMKLLKEVYTYSRIPIKEIIVVGAREFINQELPDLSTLDSYGTNNIKTPKTVDDLIWIIRSGSVSALENLGQMKFSQSATSAVSEVIEKQGTTKLGQLEDQELQKLTIGGLDTESRVFANMLMNMSSHDSQRVADALKERFGPSIKKYASRLAPELNIMQDLNLVTAHHMSVKESILDGIINISPIWIVYVDGTYHIFEGDYDPRTFFDGEGKFIQ